MEHIPDLFADRAPALKARARLFEAASRFLKKDFPQKTKIMVLSGRYEFHNKGIDLFLNTLGRLEKTMKEGESVIAYLFVLGGHRDLIPSLQCEQPSLYCDSTRSETGTSPISTHRLDYEASEPDPRHFHSRLPERP
jgi:phosphorylase/glycogen(starch) synthase